MRHTANLLRLLIAASALVFSLTTLYSGPTETELKLWSCLPFGSPELLSQIWCVLVAIASTLLLALTTAELYRGRSPEEKDG
jgi:hypothetical protein